MSALMTDRARAFAGAPAGAVTQVFMDQVPSWLTGPIDSLSYSIMSVQTNLIRICVRISAVVAWIFALACLYSAFRGYSHLFEKMQCGQHDYPGHTYDLRGKFSDGTFFIGTAMSTVLLGWVIVFFIVLPVLTLLTFWQVYTFIWSYKVLLLIVILSKCVMVVLRVLVCDTLLQTDGFIDKPICFSCAWIVLLTLGFALGALSTVIRFFMMLPGIVYRYHCFDDTLVSEEFVSMDMGYNSLLSLTYTTYEQRNPIGITFAHAICPGAHRLYGPAYLSEREVTGSGGDGPASEAQIQKQHRRRNIRNKMWLAVMLHNYPSLKKYRRWPGEEVGDAS